MGTDQGLVLCAPWTKCSLCDGRRAAEAASQRLRATSSVFSRPPFACIAMSRFLALVWCEAVAQEEWREWSDIPRVTEMDRELAVGRAVRLGIIKVGA